MSEDAAAADMEVFRQHRLAAVTGPTGDAALVGTFWIAEPTELHGFPGRWDLDAGQPMALRYTPPADGSVTTGDVTLREPLDVVATSQGGSVLHHGTGSSATVLNWPGIGLAVRLWDLTAVSSLAAIESYAYDAAWRIDGTFRPRSETVNYAYHGHGGRQEGRQVVGEVAIRVEDRNCTLLVTRNAAGLTAVFGDATNGRETYG